MRRTPARIISFRNFFGSRLSNYLFLGTTRGILNWHWHFVTEILCSPFNLVGIFIKVGEELPTLENIPIIQIVYFISTMTLNCLGLLVFHIQPVFHFGQLNGSRPRLSARPWPYASCSCSSPRAPSHACHGTSFCAKSGGSFLKLQLGLQFSKDEPLGTDPSCNGLDCILDWYRGKRKVILVR